MVMTARERAELELTGQMDRVERHLLLPVKPSKSRDRRLRTDLRKLVVAIMKLEAAL